MANPFSDLFGKSPIRPIQKHMQKVKKCVDVLPEFMDAVLDADWGEAKNLQIKIAELENKADEMKREVRLTLPKSLFLPVPRTDLLDLLTMQDKLANTSKDIAGLILGRKMEIPSEMRDLMKDFLHQSILAVSQACKATNELDELLETGFKGREVELVSDLLLELDDIESKSDQVQVELRGKLFQLENDLPPVNVIFLYKIIDLTGDIADYAQKVGSRLLRLLAH